NPTVIANNKGNSASGAGGTAPHADSRVMIFAGNDLLEGDDGGLFRLSNPNQTTGRVWSSVHGNLGTTEFLSVDYDNVNNTILAGAQDVGVAVQDPTGAASFPFWQDLAPADVG